MEAEQDDVLAKEVRDNFDMRIVQEKKLAALDAAQVALDKTQRRAERAERAKEKEKAMLEGNYDMVSESESESEDDNNDDDQPQEHIRRTLGKANIMPEEEEYSRTQGDAEEEEDEGGGDGGTTANPSARNTRRPEAFKRRGKGGLEVESEDDEDDDEDDEVLDSRMIVLPGALDDEGAGAIVNFTKNDIKREEEAVREIARQLVKASSGSSSILPNKADADKYAQLHKKVEVETYASLTVHEQHHLDRLERLVTTMKAERTKAMDKKLIDLASFTTSSGNFSEEVAVYTTAQIAENEAVFEEPSRKQKAAPSSWGYSKSTSKDEDGLDDGQNRDYLTIQKMMQDRANKARTNREKAELEQMREEQRQIKGHGSEPSLQFSGRGEEEEEEEEEEESGIGRATPLAVPVPVPVLAPSTSTSQAIDPSIAESRWQTVADAKRAGTESVAVVGSGGATQCPPRAPLPDPLQMGSKGRVVFQIACFEMVIDVILRYICTGVVKADGIVFDLVDPSWILKQPKPKPADRPIAWSAVLRHASCTPHVMRANKKSYMEMVSSISELDEECKQQLAASTRTEESVLLLTSLTLLRLVVSLEYRGISHTFVAVGTAAELPSLISTQASQNLHVDRRLHGSLKGCDDLMAMMLPKKKARKKDPPAGENGSGGGDGNKRLKTYGGGCPSPAAQLLNAQIVEDSDSRESSMNTVLEAVQHMPKSDLLATPAVKTVGDTTVPGIALLSGRAPTKAETSAVGGREFINVTQLGSISPLANQALHHLVQEGSAHALSPMKDVAQAQRAVRHKEKVVIQKRDVLEIW